MCHRLDKKSRMRGDSHVRICERLRGRFPWATRLGRAGEKPALTRFMPILVTNSYPVGILVLIRSLNRAVYIVGLLLIMLGARTCYTSELEILDISLLSQNVQQQIQDLVGNQVQGQALPQFYVSLEATASNISIEVVTQLGHVPFTSYASLSFDEVQNLEMSLVEAILLKASDFIQFVVAVLNDNPEQY